MKRFLKFQALALLLVGLTSSLFAQRSPKDSATVVLGIQVTVFASQPSWANVSGATGYVSNQGFAAGPDDNTALNEPAFLLNVIPGREYDLNIGSGDLARAVAHFNPPAGYKVMVGAPYLPLFQSTVFDTAQWGMNGMQNTPHVDVDFYLVPADGSDQLAAGEGFDPHVGDTIWNLSLGKLASGSSAGSLGWRSSTVSQDLLDASSLNFVSCDYQYEVSWETYSSDGTIKYISTPQAQFYIRRNSGTNSGYTVEVYDPSVIPEPPNGDPTQDNWSFSAPDKIEYTISNPDSSWNGDIQISRLRRGGPTDTWVLSQNQSAGTMSVIETNTDQKVSLTSTTSSGVRTEIYTQADPSGSKIAFKRKRVYQNFSWGEEMTSESLDPDGLALTTNYTYYTTAPGDGHYSKLQSVTNPDGSWVKYDYFNDMAQLGQLAGVYKPFQNSPSAYTGASTTNCDYTSYAYANQPILDNGNVGSTFGSATYYSPLPAGYTHSINGTTVAKETISSSFVGEYWYSIDRSYGNPLFRTDTIVDYSASASTQTTVRAQFDNQAVPVYAGKFMCQINPDGTQISASTENVSFYYNWLGGPSFNATAPDASTPSANTNACETYLYGTATQQDPSAVQFTGDTIPTASPTVLTQGQLIAGIWMTPFKSFRKTVVHDLYGNVAWEYTSVYVGGAPLDHDSFQIISWKTHMTTSDGYPIGYTHSDGSTWFSGEDWGIPTFDINPDGTRTDYTLDDELWRSQSIKRGKPGYNGYPSQPDITTTYTRDGAGNVTGMSTQASTGGTTYTTSTIYNLAGLVTSQTDEHGLTTHYGYSNGGSIITITAPNGATQITSHYLDGSVSSVQGTAVVNSSNQEVVNGDGTMTATTYIGTGTSRYSSTTSDWLGRTISQSSSAFNGGTFTKALYYNAAGQLAKTTQPGSAPTLYQYDGFGKLQYTGLDAEGTGTLDPAGGNSERMTETRTSIVNTGGIWAKQTLTYAFTQAGNATPVLMSETDKRLAPSYNYGINNANELNGQIQGETDTYDRYRNLTVTTVLGDRVDGLTTTTRTYPNSSTPEVSQVYNELPVSKTTKDGLTTTFQYDGLGELTSTTDPRKGASQTSYFTSGTGAMGQVSQVTDPAGDTMSYAYNSDGTLASTTDAAGDVVYHGYDYQGREIKTWGTGTYPVAYAYDSYGQKVAMRTFGNNTTNFGSSSWPLSDDGGDSKNPNPSSWTSGNTTTWAFDASSGLVDSKTDAANQAVTYTYNLNGKLATRTWSRGAVTTYTYDPNTGDQTGISYSGASAPGLTYEFDRMGHASSVTQAYPSYNLVTTLQYSETGKLLTEGLDPTFFAGLALNVQIDQTAGDYQGRTTGYTLSSGGQSYQAVTYGYDGNGRMNQITLGGGPSYLYTYLANSDLIASVSDTTSSYVQTRNWHSNRDLLDSIETGDSSVDVATVQYVYDSLGRRTSKASTGAIFANYPASALADSYGYNTRSELISAETFQNSTASGTAMLGRNFSFAYDQIGNRTSSGVDTNATTYDSNSLNEYSDRHDPGAYVVSGLAPTTETLTVSGTTLPSSAIQGQFYSLALTASNSTAPAFPQVDVHSSVGEDIKRNAWIPQTPETYTYDLDGNITQDGRWHYTWDAENRLTSMETIGKVSGDSTAVWNSGVPQVHIDFMYDYQGRRISKVLKTWNGTAFAQTAETRYVYNHWNLVSEFAVSSGTLTQLHGFLWGIDLSGNLHGAGGVGGLLALETASGALELPAYDGNGNVLALIDRSSGQVTAKYEYSPFGDLLRASGLYATNCPIRFSSKYSDDETHLLYFGHRYSNPSLGRFLGRDGIEEKGGLHLFAYCANNAVNLYDILGNQIALGDQLPSQSMYGDMTGLNLGSIYATHISNAAAEGFNSQFTVAAQSASDFLEKKSVDAANAFNNTSLVPVAPPQGTVTIGQAISPATGQVVAQSSSITASDILLSGASPDELGALGDLGAGSFLPNDAAGSDEIAAATTTLGYVAPAAEPITTTELTDGGLQLIRTAGSGIVGVLGSIVTYLATPTTMGKGDMVYPTWDENGNPQEQYIVRGGQATAVNLANGSASYMGVYGFSVQSAPGATVDQLALAGRFPNKTISYTTTTQLNMIGVQMVPTPGAGFHQTIVTGQGDPTVYDRISSIFTTMPNPYPTPRG